MPVVHTFMMPEYFPRFTCKGGDCRNTCCRGWGISVSLDEYFRLLSMSCPAKIRRQLDGAFHPADAPSPERYAMITPKFDGDCPLHQENGWCGLQVNCGEDALPAICRRYPRNVRLRGGIYECSCSNSCERTLELLFESKDPLTCIEKEFAFDIPEPEETLGAKEIALYAPLRTKIISLLNDRSKPLPVRLSQLGRLITAAMDHHENTGMTTPDLPQINYNTRATLPVQHELLHTLEETSPALAYEEPLVECPLKLGAGEHVTDESVQRYEQNAKRFNEILPDNERYFEQMLTHHIFYEGFPFSDARMDMWHAYMALCGCYALLRLTAVGAVQDKTPNAINDFIDLMSRVFRAVEHSRFDWNAAVTLNRLGWTGQREMDLLLTT